MPSNVVTACGRYVPPHRDQRVNTNTTLWYSLSISSSTSFVAAARPYLSLLPRTDSAHVDPATKRSSPPVRLHSRSVDIVLKHSP